MGVSWGESVGLQVESESMSIVGGSVGVKEGAPLKGLEIPLSLKVLWTMLPSQIHEGLGPQNLAAPFNPSAAFQPSTSAFLPA